MIHLKFKLIDLHALKQEADSSEGDRTVVSRSWLKQAYAELLAAREAVERLGLVYGIGGAGPA